LIHLKSPPEPPLPAEDVDDPLPPPPTTTADIVVTPTGTVNVVVVGVINSCCPRGIIAVKNIWCIAIVN
jgi:hypothetical protein